MAKKADYDDFKFPKRLLDQIQECSRDSAFFLIYKDAKGSLIPVFSCDMQTDAIAMTIFGQKVLSAIESAEDDQIFENFEESGEESGQDNIFGEDEE